MDNLLDIVDNPLTRYRVINRMPRSSLEPSAEGGSEEEGTGMVRSSGRVILVCEHCEERLVLGEPEEVWLSTRTLFECECGRGVSLASRLSEPSRAENYETQK